MLFKNSSNDLQAPSVRLIRCFCYRMQIQCASTKSAVAVLVVVVAGVCVGAGLMNFESERPSIHFLSVEFESHLCI